MLYLIATPIGNLKDITLRSLEVLKTVDAIICEDTRRSSVLLHHYEINKPLIILNDFNESRKYQEIIERLKNGENFALISDAGTPLISDPGFKLVRECVTQGVEVDSLPGPSSVITALTLSGLPTDKFMFLGFLPDKSGHRQQTYQKMQTIHEVTPTTFILFVAPFKLIKTLEEMQKELGDIPVSLAKELTKIYQSVQLKKISEWLEEYKKKTPKGEWILLLHL